MSNCAIACPATSAAATSSDSPRGIREPSQMQLTRRTKRDEAGNVIVIIGVIMVLTFLSIAVVARTLGGLKSTKQGQDFSGALAQADAGVADALFRLDQIPVSTPLSSFCVGNSVACTIKAVPGAPTVQYT